jgi:MFS family permease
VNAAEPPPISRSDKAFNFAACLVDAIGWPLGSAFFSTTTILPVFLRHLNASNSAIGLLTALINLLVFLPGPLVVPYISRLSRARGYLFWVAIAERFALLPLVGLTLLWGETRPSWLLAAVFVCFTFHAAAMGINQPAYWVVIGKTIPPRWRGRLFGYGGGIAGVLGIGTEWLLRHRVLAGPNGGFPHGFSVGFAIGFVLLTASVLPLGLIREPAQEPPPRDPHEGAGQTGAERAKAAFAVYRRVWESDAGFRGFLQAQVVFALVAMATPFFVLYAGKQLGAGAGAVAGYTATLIFASAFGSLGWGALSDRFGNKTVLVAGAACAVLSALLALVAPDPTWFFAVFVASALATAGVGLAGNNIVMEYAGTPRDIPLYTVFYNTITALPRTAAPLLGGLIADQAGYRALFAAALVLGLATLALTLRFRAPAEGAAAGAPPPVA